MSPGREREGVKKMNHGALIHRDQGMADTL